MFVVTFNKDDDLLTIPRAPNYQPVEGEPQRFAVTRGAGEQREDGRSYYTVPFEFEDFLKSTAASTCQFTECRLLENDVVEVGSSVVTEDDQISSPVHLLKEGWQPAAFEVDTTERIPRTT